jgi:hypothetical protein
MPKFSFPLIKSSPTDSEYAEICTDGGSRPPCQLKVTAYSGAAPSSDTYGNLSVVNLPLKSETTDCETLIEIWMQTGCPPGTPDVVCDDVQNPTEIAQNSSETIYILDGDPPYTWEIVGGHGYSLEWESTGDEGGRPDERKNSWNTLYSSADSCGTAQVKITDNCHTEIICEFDSSVVSDLEYDWVNSAQTVARSANVNVFVTGGTPPYTWSISGTGFSLHNIETYSLSNTVYADSTACGSGLITVEDVCGVQIEGSIRCTTGAWVEVADTDNGSTPGETCPDIMFGVGIDVLYTGGGVSRFDTWRGQYFLEEYCDRIDIGSTGPCSLCPPNCNTQPLGCTSCLLGRMPTCQEGYAWSEAGSGPCCHVAYGHYYCHYIARRRLFEWRCP